MVYGAGISGVGVAEVLADLSVQVHLYDAKACNIDPVVEGKITNAGGVLEFAKDAQTVVDKCDIIVLSPGISIYSADVEYAKKIGKSVISEVEVAYLINKGKLLAITGTNGKTTTTALVGEMVKKLPVHSAVGGNIGQALSRQAMCTQSPQDILVAEISSFQLEAIEQFKPYVSAILNITPDHLDRHKTFEGYVEAKAKVFQNQGPDEYVILNAEDQHTLALAAQAKAKVCLFSSSRQLEQGIFLNAEGVITLVFNNERVEFCHYSKMQLFGKHNIENVLVACAMAYFAGVSAADIVKTLEEFQGVEHRIEYIRTLNGVRYYNDSKATNPESTIKALEAFDAPVILIAGGYDKMTSLDEMMELVKTKTIQAIFIGAAKERFAAEAEKHGIDSITLLDNFEDATAYAHRIAGNGDVVLLSPACASYDMFNNFEVRGRHFKKLVNELQ